MTPVRSKRILDSKRKLYSRVLQRSFDSSQINTGRWDKLDEVVRLNSEEINQRDQKVKEIFAACPPRMKAVLTGNGLPSCSAFKEREFNPNLEKPAGVVACPHVSSSRSSRRSTDLEKTSRSRGSGLTRPKRRLSSAEDSPFLSRRL